MSQKIAKNRKNAALQTVGLTVRYGSMTALDGLDLDIYAGELVGVIGPNGAGKTSFIKALCGRAKSEGIVRIAGDTLRRGGDRRNHIGLVPQDIGLYAHMTAKENLETISKLLKINKNKQKHAVEDALDSVGMTEKSNVLVSELSGGMKRRINVAAAIMHEPALIIFDEPTAGVDIPARDVVHRLARTLAERGMAVILVTHELEQAEALCDKILVLHQGRKLAFDSPTSLLTKAFSGSREVIVRYAAPPDADVITAMLPFEFRQAELSNVWIATTEAKEVSFVSAFVTALKGGDDLVREISVRRPGLTSLMHRIEISGQLGA